MHHLLFNRINRGLLAAAFVLGAGGLAPAQSAKSFRPGDVWRDTDGQPIRAHDGGFYFENRVYCWFGEDKRAGGAAGHTHAIASQVTFILRVEHGGYKDRPAFIFVADRWNERHLRDSRLLFLPVTVHGRGEISVKWHDEWDLSLFDAHTQQKEPR